MKKKKIKNDLKLDLKDKKTWVIIGVMVIALSILILSINRKGVLNIPNKVKVVKSEVASLTLEKYENDEITMDIPKGWKVETGGSNMYYAIKVYDPEDVNYQIFAILKAEPFLKNDKAKTWYQSYYNSFGGVGNKMLADAVVLDTPSVESFYSNFNLYTAFAKEFEPSYKDFTFPDLKNFAAIESFESNTQLKSISKDDKTLRGTFQNSRTNTNGEGLFMASIIDSGKNMTLGYDILFYTMYNIIGITTGEYDLVNYQEILTKSLNSLVYKDSFVNNTIKAGKEQTEQTLRINATIQGAYDSYNNAWSSRQKTYDITSQKYSDSTLGYERVYNTDTGEIYKAYNGFTDDYDGTKYKPITDDMYTENISGYIEK